jgi:hypothetical protein
VAQYLNCFAYCCTVTGASRDRLVSTHLSCSKTIFHPLSVAHLHQTGLSVYVKNMYSSFQSIHLLSKL